MKRNKIASIAIAIGLLFMQTDLYAGNLPNPTSADFCIEVQKLLASTDLTGENTIFEDMPSYRHSKPSPKPLKIYQVVTYNDDQPILVSCKVKTADHLRAVHGDNAAGKQSYCPAITRKLLAEAITELQTVNPEAAVRASGFKIVDNEPFATGRSYLEDFQLSFKGDDGATYINTPGLQTDWENWMFWILPDKVRGQTYCHIATKSYLKSLALNEIAVGTMVGTADDAPTQPRN